ncbi:twin-arginine translocation signal domain-containing protein [Mesorhizobium muleiense]|uniref:twin-arginine translocation signal domain-containing protein n=1 Tax=Mesorhizobium muleiense TaxID=1004279 RepID=UPI003AFA1B67
MKDDRGEANGGSAHGAPSQTLSRRKFLKVSMTGAAIAGAGGLASYGPAYGARRGNNAKACGTLSGFSKQGSRPLAIARRDPSRITATLPAGAVYGSKF